MRNALGAMGRGLAVAAVAIATLVSSYAWGQAAPPKLVVKETVIGRLEAKLTQSYALSPDFNRVAVLNKKGEKYAVTLDGVEGKEYEWVIKNSVTFSADSKRLGFIAQQGDKVFAVVDGKEGKPYREIANTELLFAAAGGRYAYFAKNKPADKFLLVIDEQEGKEFDKVGNLSFSPDGKRVAYIAETGGKQFAVIDGAVGAEKTFDRVPTRLDSGLPVFTWSPDSKRYAYIGLNKVAPAAGAAADPADAEKYQWMVVVDGKPGKPYDTVRRPFFSSDGTQVAYAALMQTSIAPGPATAPTARSFVVLNDKELKSYDAIVAETIRFSPDGKRLAYVATDSTVQKGRGFYVIDDQRTPTYDQLIAGTFMFSPDSKRYAYQCVKGNAKVVVNGIDESNAFEDVREAEFSADSASLAYLARRQGRWLAVVNNTEQNQTYDGAGNLQFSKDGKRMAFVAVRGEKQTHMIALDGVEGRGYPLIVAQNVAFTADGRFVLYEARKSEDAGSVVFALASSAQAEPVESKPHFGTLRGSRIVLDSATSFHALVVRGEKDQPQEIVRWQVEIQ
jgi:Tol biopolymer transport system component